MKLEQKVLAYIKKHHMIKERSKIVIGISGGADSVCLLLLLLNLREEYQLQLYGVHVNHGIRGEEAKEDEDFVGRLCEEYNIPLRVVKKEVLQLAKKEKKSLEEVGREVRYEIFGEYAKEVGANYIAVAHHKNDQAETILQNLCRGSGLAGMVGIPIKRENIIRPLLCVSRKEIEEYLKIKGQPYQIDSTNLENEYTRNKWRNVILPLLEEQINTQVVSHVANAAEHFRELQAYVEKSGKSAYERMVEKKEKALLLSLDSWQQEDVVIQKWIIRQMLFELSGKQKNIEQIHVLHIMELGQKQVGRQMDLPYNITVKKAYGKLEFFIDCEKIKIMKEHKKKKIINKTLENGANKHINILSIEQISKPSLINAVGSDVEKKLIRELEINEEKKSKGKLECNVEKKIMGKLDSKEEKKSKEKLECNVEKKIRIGLDKNMEGIFDIYLGAFQKEKIMANGSPQIKFEVLNIEKFLTENQRNPLKIPKNNCTKCFDYDKMKSTVYFRKTMENDYIQIDKDGHRKKLKKLFKDEKIPAEQRKDIWGLADDNHVLWIPGIRISEGFRVEENTKRVLIVSIE